MLLRVDNNRHESHKILALENFEFVKINNIYKYS